MNMLRSLTNAVGSFPMFIAARFLVLTNRPRFYIDALLLSVVLMGLSACGGNSEVVANPLDIDTSYATQGQAVVPLAVKAGGVGPSVMQTDGKLVIAGWRQTGTLPAGVETGRAASEVYVLRLNEDGSRDGSFGNGGEVRFNVKGSDTVARIKMQRDGKILLAVNTSEACVIDFLSLFAPCRTPDGVPASSAIAMVRLTPNGLLDVSFGDAGIVQATASSGALDLAPQADGKILLLRSNSVARARIFGWSLTRYTDSGTQDVTFNNGNPVSSTCQSDGESMVIQSDEKIVVAGSQGVFYGDPTVNPGFCLERINADGSHDLNYRKAGLWTTFDTNVTLTALSLLSGDDVLAVGRSCGLTTCGLVAARLDNDGRLNPVFGTNGVVKLALGNSFYLTDSVAMHIGGLVTLGIHNSATTTGEAQTYQPVWIAFDANGRAPSDFGVNGISTGTVDAKFPVNFLRDTKGRWMVINKLTLPDGNLEIAVNRLIGES